MNDANAHDDAPHVEKLGTYLAIFAALIALTLLTVWTSGLHLPHLVGNTLALAIATTKATLVVLWFMHVRHSAPMTKVAILAGVFMFVTLEVLTLSDVLTRGFWGIVGR
jgi:cytochrome c oxidase subunit IV